jgi:GntR family transcriptional regulator/MocR family aminotransferase
MSLGRAAVDLDLPLQLKRAADRPLHRQIVAQLRDAIRAGQLPAGTRLPSTRRLAAALDITRNVAVAAYADLVADGYLASSHGSGAYVEATLPPFPRPVLPAPTRAPRWLRVEHEPPVADTPLSPRAIDFRPGVPSLSPLALDPWRRAWRDAVTALPPAGYGAPAGLPALREAIADYLGRSRGLACAPDDVVITAGAGHALALIAQATLAPGDTAALEEPGYPTARRVLRAHGARLLPVPVDDDGLRVDALPRGPSAPPLVYTTPSHQYPLGVRLSVARRLALLEWARATDSLIVEDDYDSEFRFDAPPLPALAGRGADGCVAYVGTFSKVLTPALRVGYLVAPAPLGRRVEELKRAADDHTPWPVEQALAAFITGGHLDRHIRRMRRHYAWKRQALDAALAPLGRLAAVRGLDAGLHAYLEVRPDLDPAHIAHEAYGRGVVVTTLDAYYVAAPDRRGLLLGYGGLDEADVTRGARLLADVIAREARDTRPHGSLVSRAEAP